MQRPKTSSNKYGHINLSGKRNYSLDIEEELLIVGNEDEEGNLKWGMTELDGRIIIPIEYDEIEEDICYLIVKKDKKCGAIGLDGKIIIPVEYDKVEVLEIGFFIKKNEKFGLTNAIGEIIIPVEYDSIDDFYIDIGKGLSVVKKDRKNVSETKIKHKTSRRIPSRLNFKILKRDNYACQACGRSPAKEIGVELHVDHIKPWSKGGETIEENLQTLCSECNLGKGDIFEE